MENTLIKWINKWGNSLSLKQFNIERIRQPLIGLVFFLILIMMLPIRSPCQVDLSTGRVMVDIPLYSYSDPNNRLALNINLHYQGGGIKVNDISSDVGANWVLNAGGYIKRHTVGGLDDKYPEGTMYQNGINSDDKDAFVPIGSAPQVNNFYKDNELDIFEFNFNGRHGTFSIGRNKEVMQYVDTKMKISFTEQDMTDQNIVTRISKFSIVTEDGIKYIFDKKETITKQFIIFSSYHDNGTQPSGNIIRYQFPLPVYPDPYVRKSFVDTWDLSEIKNTLTGKSIQLQYNDIAINKATNRSETNTDIYTGNDAHNHTVTTVVDLIHYPRLNKIIFPGGIDLKLNYENRPRLDYGTDIYNFGLTGNALSSIIIENNGTIDKEYNFSYVYLYKNSELSYESANALPHSNIENYSSDQDRLFLRLALKELKVSSSGKTLSPYKFTYRLYSGASGPTSPSDIVPPRLTTKKNGFGYYYGADYHRLGNGLLEKIQYPKGGYTEFYYIENAKVHSDWFGLESNGVSVSKIVTYDGISHQNDITTMYNYVLHDKNGNILSGNPSSIYGNYESYNTLQKSSFVETSGAPNFLEVLQVFGYLVGSKGFLQSVFSSILNKIISFFIGSDFKTINYEIRKTGGSFNPKLPVRYSEVGVIRSSPEKNLGKTIYTFTSFDDIPPLYSNQSPPYSQKNIAPDWCYGLPKKVKIYNANGELVQMRSYTYNFLYHIKDDYRFESAKLVPKTILSVKSAHYNTYKSHITWLKDYYYPIIGRVELKTLDIRNFSLNGNYIERVTRYKYDLNTFHLKEQTSENSVGNTVIKRIYYPTDYTSTGAIQTMKDHNMLAFPISSEIWVKKGNDNPELIKGTIMDYQVIGNGDIRPVNVYGFHNNQPITQSEIGLFDPAVPVRNTNYFKKDGSLIYDAQGNLIQKYSHGRTTSNVYGYDNRYLIAKAKNASNSEIAYTSFETDEKGNWQYSGIPDPVGSAIPRAVTGKKYYDLSNGALTKSIQGLTNGKNYKLSYWTRNSSAFHLNYSSTSTKGETVQGWTYFLHVFTAGSSNVILSGNGSIDEVRLYPADAQMATATYNPLTGKTSECDADNKLRYYEYDELGRLLLIRDKNQDIIQKIAYHDAGQTTNNAVYYNQVKSQSFTKNDCSSGYMGSPVTYTVPANKYLSTIDIASANAKAQADIDANGQAYANAHGACIAPDLTISQKTGSNETRPFSIKVTNADTQSIVFDDSFSSFGPALPFSISLPSGGPFRIEMDAMSPITVSINGVQKVMNGTQSWLFVTAPITIEVWFNP